ncbi:MAG TPA: DUF6644 family protein [Hyphomonadaceae bacterium]|jgi:hypothetical protein|nr:DUF6644 family protein [Hyphomonadaceae bacterium]
MDDLLRWVRDTPLGHFMRETGNAFPVAEMSHFISLSLLMGVMLVVDLRILGVFKQASYSSVLKLIPLAIVGFAINLISGVCFIVTNPFLYFTNPAFYWKLTFILLGGLNALWFTFAEHRLISGLPTDARAPALARVMAAASLGMWTLVLLLGRLLPTFAPVAGG